MMIEEGAAVRVSNTARGAVAAVVLKTTTPAALPSLPSHDFDEMKTASVRRMLQAWKVDYIALIQYRYGAREVAFIALQIAGLWFDLKKQQLTIEPLPPPPPPTQAGITDQTIAGALLWPELSAVADIAGPVTGPALWQFRAGRWSITAHGSDQPQTYTTTSGAARTIPPRAVAVDYDGTPAGMIGPGETADISGDHPAITARELRRALHEAVYQHRRNASL